MAGKKKHSSDDDDHSSDNTGKESTKSKGLRISRRKSNATSFRKTNARKTPDKDSDAQITSEDSEPEVVEKSKKKSSTRKIKAKAKNTSDEDSDAQITSEDSEPEVVAKTKKKSQAKNHKRTSGRSKKQTYENSEDSDTDGAEKNKIKSSTTRKTNVKAKNTSDVESTSEDSNSEKTKKKSSTKRTSGQSKKYVGEDSESEVLKKKSPPNRISARVKHTNENASRRPKRNVQRTSRDSTEKKPIDQIEVNMNEASSQEESGHSDADESSKKPTTKRERKPRVVRPKKEEEEQYEVEAILDFKIEDKMKYFLIRWKGYDSSVDSWEDRRSLNCPGLIAKFYEQHPEARISTYKRKRLPTYDIKKKKKQKPPPALKIDEEPDYDSEAFDENQEWKVEKIIDVRYHRDKKRDFLIRWEGYSYRSDSWEPEENLDCSDLIKKFLKKLDNISNATVKELRPVRKPTQHFILMTQSRERRLSRRHHGRQRVVYYDCDVEI